MEYFFSFAITLLGFLSVGVAIYSIAALIEFLDDYTIYDGEVIIIIAILIAFVLIWYVVHLGIF